MPAPMMLPDWANLAAIISAMIDVIQFGRDAFEEFLESRQEDPDLGRKADGLATALSTYSEEETEAIIARIERCRRRFVEEGAGEARRICICSVLRDVRDGNGGILPEPEWERAYKQLRCDAA